MGVFNASTSPLNTAPPNNRPTGHDAADRTRGRPEGSPCARAGLALGLIGEPVFGEPLNRTRCEPEIVPEVWRARLQMS